MILSIQDILMLSLQFFYAFGGLVLMGSLIFNIMKNQALVNEKRLRFEQDFDVELTSQLADNRPQDPLYERHAGTTEESARYREAGRTKNRASGTLPGAGKTGADTPLKRRPVSARENVVKQGKVSRYSLAASLAARGINAKEIRHRVGLPQCEIDLIANINDTYAKGRWKAHQPMLDAIESGM